MYRLRRLRRGPAPAEPSPWCPWTIRPSRKKEESVVALANALAERRAEEEKIALQTAETAAEDGLYRLCKAVAKSVRLVGEDILREAGYMLPQSGNAHNLLASWAVSPPAAGFPLDAVLKLMKSSPAMIKRKKERNP